MDTAFNITLRTLEDNWFSSEAGVIVLKKTRFLISSTKPQIPVLFFTFTPSVFLKKKVSLFLQGKRSRPPDSNFVFYLHPLKSRGRKNMMMFLLKKKRFFISSRKIKSRPPDSSFVFYLYPLKSRGRKNMMIFSFKEKKFFHFFKEKYNHVPQISGWFFTFTLWNLGDVKKRMVFFFWRKKSLHFFKEK